MRQIIVFEDDGYRNLLPLTYWRTTFELRCGYTHLFEHIAGQVSAGPIALFCRPALAEVAAERFHLPVNTTPPAEQAVLVNGRWLADQPLSLARTPAVQWDGEVPLIIQADRALLDRLTPQVLLDPRAAGRLLAPLPVHQFVQTPRIIRYPWDLVHNNESMLQLGWKRRGEPAELAGRICDGAHLLNRAAIYVGPGSTIKPGVVLDAENGPIYIGAGVTISPNCSIEGPGYIGDGSLIQPGSALRDAMSIGPHCKVGGELEASIIHGFSNKQHDGFLGHSYLAEWVNLAADTVTSDLKNTYGTVRVPVNGLEVESGQMFVGLTMGDHSKTGIGQVFPTGAVVGFGCNMATREFAPKFVPSFTWLTGQGASRYDPNRCIEIAKMVMLRRAITMTAAEEALFRQIAKLAGELETPLKSGNHE